MRQSSYFVAIGLAVAPACDGVRADRVVGVEVDGGAPVAEMDERFLSFAVDSSQVAGTSFWNPDTGELDPEVEVQPYDFSRPRLRALTAELAPAWLRIGGTDADHLYYDLSAEPAEPPAPFRGLLTAEAWDAVNGFALDMGLSVLFTVAAGPGPRDAGGAWTSDNARELLEYTVGQGYPVEVWELANEPNAFLLEHGEAWSPEDYGADFQTFAGLRDEADPTAAVAGPTTFFWPTAGEFMEYTEPALEATAGTVDVVTWHYYPQQSTRCGVATVPAGPEVMLDPERLDEIHVWADLVEEAAAEWAPEAEIWLGESGNAQCGGSPGVSDRYAGGFWWLDQLGLVARRGQQAVVRQTLSGSDYGLLDDQTLAPRPDYWTSVLWRRLVGPEVLDTASDDPLLRAWAHCAREGEGAVTLVLVNLDRDAIEVELSGIDRRRAEVYLLEADALDALEVRLNGKVLSLGDDDALPPLEGERVGRVVVPPRSYGFAVIEGAGAAACGG